MINKQYTIFDTLSEDLIKIYEKVKALINKIYNIIKTNKNSDNIKKDFRKSYMTYSHELKKRGYKNEAKYIIVICGEYLYLMEKPDLLLAKKQYFKELFDKIDDLICIKTNKPEIYHEEYVKFRRFYIEQSGYLAKELYTPDNPLDEETCYKILSPFSKWL